MAWQSRLPHVCPCSAAHPAWGWGWVGVGTAMGVLMGMGWSWGWGWDDDEMGWDGIRNETLMGMGYWWNEDGIVMKWG